MPSARILVLEDSILVAMALQTALEECGYDVVSAGSIAAARARMTEARIDAALLDVRLPDGDSRELALELHRQGCHVALVTGAEDDELPAQAASLPRFPKPTRIDCLLRWIESRVAGGPEVA